MLDLRIQSKIIWASSFTPRLITDLINQTKKRPQCLILPNFKTFLLSDKNASDYLNRCKIINEFLRASEKFINAFQCSLCGKSFASHAAHDSHVRRTHASQTLFQFKCEFCDKTFQHKRHLNFHQQSVHHLLCNSWKTFSPPFIIYNILCLLILLLTLFLFAQFRE